MAEEIVFWRRTRFWIWLVALVILLLFLYFFQPFEQYIVENVPKTTFATVIFWFVSAAAVVAYAASHWQSFRRNIIRSPAGLQVDGLAFDSIQITLLIAVMLCAGATLQAVERLSEYVMSRGAILDSPFGDRLLVILLFVILTILFYLLHLLARALRIGWQPRRPHPRTQPTTGTPETGRSRG
jgi:hypothetical protein